MWPSSPDRCRFVVLAYSPSLTETIELPCLVVLRLQSSGQLHGQIELLSSPNWDSLPKQIQKYLLELADDWRSTPPGETEDLMMRLERLSFGPIRACKTEQCNRADLESAIREIGIAGPWTKLG
jgi:hypothetical protein